MKKLILIALLLLPQNIFADDFSYFGSFENRGAFLGGNSGIPIAEHKGEGDEARKPLLLDFSNDYSFKIGAGFKWRGFDVGFYYTDFSTDSSVNDKFKDTYPLGTGSRGTPSSGWYPDGHPAVLAKHAQDYIIYPNHAVGDLYPTGKVTGIAKSDFGFNHYDLEVGAIFKVDDIALRFSGGMRYAKYEESLNVERGSVPSCHLRRTDIGNPALKKVDCGQHWIVPAATPDDFDSYPPRLSNARDVAMDIEAIGPRIGLDVAIPFTKNISFIGGVSWAVLFGNRNLTDNYKSIATATPIIGYETPPIERDPGGSPIVLVRVPGSGPIYGDDIVTEVDQGGYIEKDKSKVIQNLELELGLEYKWKISRDSTLSFLAGYRYDVHYGVMTSCGSSKIVDGTPEEPTQNSYGTCGDRLEDGSISHKSDNFTTHGPFIKTTLKF